MDLIWQGLVDAVTLIISLDAGLLRLAGFSLAVSLAATGLAAIVGIPLGVALATGRGPARAAATTLVNAGMGLPPVLVGLMLALLLWRTGPLGSLGLIYTPLAIVLAQFVVAAPIVAGLTRGAISALDLDLPAALRTDGAGAATVGRELVRASLPQVLLAVSAGFGRAIAEVGASLIVGGNIAGSTRTLTTAITLETSRGNFALAIAFGIVLLLVVILVNLAIGWLARASGSH